MKKLIALALVVSASTSQAVTLNFAGTVDSALGSLGAGTSLTGTVSYDESAAARGGSTSSQAVFDSVTALSFAVGSFGGGFSSPLGSSEIQVDNNVLGTGDRFAVVIQTSGGFLPALVLDGTYTLSGFGFRLDDVGQSVFSDALSQPTAIDFADFTSGSFFLFFDGFASIVSGTITGVSTEVAGAAAVPLPASLPLVLTGLAALGFIGRGRRAY